MLADLDLKVLFGTLAYKLIVGKMENVKMGSRLVPFGLLIEVTIGIVGPDEELKKLLVNS